jgi:Aminomethyltransferase folate-binding domain
MIRTSPFHERTSARNETRLWEHWSGMLAANRYQMSDKFEYFAVRNAAGVCDSSPLYKYRIHGPDAERFLSGVLTRDIRTCAPGNAQYTVWSDDRGFVIEDGVILRPGKDEFLLTAAEPNLAYFQDLIGRDRVVIEEVSDEVGVLAVQGPRSRDLLARLRGIPPSSLTLARWSGSWVRPSPGGTLTQLDGQPRTPKRSATSRPRRPVRVPSPQAERKHLRLDEALLPPERNPLCGSVGRRRLGHQGGLAVSGRELAVLRAEEAQPAVAVVARAVLGHGAFVEHG